MNLKHRVFLLVVVISTFILPVASYAKPIYLSCELSRMEGGVNKTGEYIVKLDEDTGKITQSIGDNNQLNNVIDGEIVNAFNTDGFFSDSKIIYKRLHFSSDGIKYLLKYNIDRTTLDMNENLFVGTNENQLRNIRITNGVCKIIKKRKRKI